MIHVRVYIALNSFYNFIDYNYFNLNMKKILLLIILLLSLFLQETSMDIQKLK